MPSLESRLAKLETRLDAAGRTARLVAVSCGNAEQGAINALLAEAGIDERADNTIILLRSFRAEEAAEHVPPRIVQMRALSR